MHVIADRRHRIDRLNNLARKIIRMRSGKTHPPNPRHIRHRAQQIHKTPAARSGIAIRIHRLSQQLNFGVARVGQPPRLSQHRFARPAAFRPARARHHAVRAGIIAAFNDRDVGAQQTVAPGDLRLKSLVRVEVQTRHPPPARFKLLDQLRQLPVARRPAHQTDPRRAFENFFAFLLRQTAQHADNFPVGKRFPVSQSRKNLLRRLLPYAASVVQNQIRLRRSLHRPVAAALQHARDLLRIVVVHLAAKRLDEERLPRRAAATPAPPARSAVFDSPAQRQRQAAQCAARAPPQRANGFAAGQRLNPDVECLSHSLLCCDPV